MATDLSQFVWSHTLVDTHEHMLKEQDWLTTGPDDVLQDLFGNYVPADLISAGATQEAMKRASDGKDPDVAGRFAGIENAWNAIRHTGYGEAVQLIAERVYGIAEITPEACSAAAPRLQALRSPGQRLAMLQESAGLDHIQTDDFVWACLPDESGPEFFLYDLSWVNFCSGNLDVEKIAGETGVTIRDLPTLNEAMEALFHRYGPLAIAVKAQHAYNRTLLWQERSPADAERALQISLTDPNGRDEATRLCLGDWCWARGVELAIEYNLPFKIHTGYYAGVANMPVDRIPAGNLCALLKKYPKARFVLMHIAYPYSQELVALVKHYPNAYADLCWAWSIDPFSSMDFLRRFLHAAPVNKVFGFGGDTRWPTGAFAYAVQARRWLERTLQAEVSDGYLTEKQALAAARRWMRDNQYDCFDVEGTRGRIQAARAA